jgi:hypothetical protein
MVADSSVLAQSFIGYFSTQPSGILPPFRRSEFDGKFDGILTTDLKASI